MNRLTSQLNKNDLSDIQNQVEDMQHSTHEAVDQISSTISDVNDVGDMITSIAAAVEQQDAATNEIARSARLASDNSDSVSNNIAGLADTVGETGAQSSALLAAVDHLDEYVHALQNSTKEFLTHIRKDS